MMNDELNLSFAISFEDLPSFIEHWAGLYRDPKEHLYEEYIGQGLTDYNLEELFIWKSTPRFVNKEKIERYLDDYKTDLNASKKWEEKYLVAEENNGGAIWNIFYLHVLSKNQNLNKKLSYVYPIFDQHVYRTMHFMQTGQLDELPDSSSKKKKSIVYEKYEDYRKFYKDIESKTRGRIDIKDDSHGRKIDRALFTFGQFLKKVKPYQRTD